MRVGEIYETICGTLGLPGQMLSGSKTAYTERFPDHTVVFNSNLIVEDVGKLWFGDIDLTLSADKLQFIANAVGAKVYVLREQDARFKYEDKPRLENAVQVFEPVGV